MAGGIYPNDLRGELDPMVATLKQASVSEEAPLARALNNLSNQITDLQESIQGLIGDIGPITRPDDEKDGGVPASSRTVGSEVTNYINDLADRLLWQKLLIDAVRKRVEC